MDREDNAELAALLPLTPAVFYVLLALTGRPKHGYAIMQEVERRTEGQVKMGPGTLYGTIKRLLREGLIQETSPPSDIEDDDSRRRYYQLTRRGRRLASLEAERLEDLVRLARSKELLTNPEKA